jgi:hypothetical protein
METYKIVKADLVDFFEPHTRISEVFTWLETDFLSQNKLVCQFIINGQELTEGDEIDWAAKPFEMIQDIQVRVQGEDSLVQDVVEAWLEALPETIAFIENVTQHTDHGPRKFNTRDLLELVHQQETFVSSLMSLKGPLRKYGLDSNEWDQAEQTLHAYVMQCVKHLESKNFVQLLETLEYDGAHALEKWRTILSTMKEKIGNHNSAKQSASVSGSSSK